MFTVIKFGGSSVANAAHIQKTIEIINSKKSIDVLIVVVSALGGTTDALLQAADEATTQNTAYKSTIATLYQKHIATASDLFLNQIPTELSNHIETWFTEINNLCDGIFLIGELSLRSKDKIASYGELLSSKIIATKIEKAVWVISGALIKTNQQFGNAQVDFDSTNKNINAFFTNTNDKLFIAPGFIATTDDNVITTLGRGGSDYTAAIFAAAVKANALEIWTDVSGMMTADPRLVANSKQIPEISYQEAMELCHFGAKVVYPPTIQPVMQKNIPVWIKNTFAPTHKGTIIKNEVVKSNNIICGISSIKNISLLSLEGAGMLGIPGFSKRLFEALAFEKINVILITQSSSEHSICVAVATETIAAAKNIVDKTFAIEIETNQVEPLIIENELSIIALVGENMKNHTGVSGKMFYALGKNGINIRAIAQGSSERNISSVIKTTDVNKAVNVLHQTFFESEQKQLNVFVVGVGTVGSKLLQQINQQTQFLLQEKNINLKVVGLANSKQFVIDEQGIDLDNYTTQLAESNSGKIAAYCNVIINSNLVNTVFVDVSASDVVAATYAQFLQKNIAVVACNKVAASAPFADYKKLKLLAKEYNAPFLIETNVGAGLPIIGTLNDLIYSGDKIIAIDAVLSGTLNFVFNNYDGNQSFASIVQQAQTEGYTEPDPRLDLSGTDVMRKILILAREAGYALEMDNIENNNFMPASCMVGTVADFYIALEKEEPHFKKLYASAKEKNCKLKFVASFKNGNAHVGLQYIDEQHNFYHLYGKDNIVQFYTERYQEQPLVIKGAGAGAAVTASGVFADIIRTLH